MKRLIMMVFVLLTLLSVTNAQGIEKKENFFKINKIEPVIGFNMSFNTEGNSVEGMIGANFDKAFSFYLGGFSLVNYYHKGFNSSNGVIHTDLMTGIRGGFLKIFWNIFGHADYESKIIGGVSISIASFSLEYESLGDNNFYEKRDATVIIPAGEFGVELGWSRLTAIIKYVPYENVYYPGASKIYIGTSLIVPISISNHKKKWGY